MPGLKEIRTLELPPTADFHVHLRDGPMMEVVTPTIMAQGGVDTVMVMPNLTPPVTTVAHALAYRKRLQALAPGVTFLMSLYLHESMTPATIADAAAAGITNVKSYPAGVTTNSSAGVLSYDAFYPVFAAMEQHGLILNLHGELPSSAAPAAPHSPAVTVLNAEALFLPTLHTLHAAFPRLRIVLEHVTTAAAVAAVRACGPTVAGTITAHHLFLTVDDWAGDPLHFCKPVAKTPEDRAALLRAALAVDDPRGPRFFFGSDSAPHDVRAKRGGGPDGRGSQGCAAGVFTQPVATQLVCEAFVAAVESGAVRDAPDMSDRLAAFLSTTGRAFYGLQPHGVNGRMIVLERGAAVVAERIVSADGTVEVLPFKRGLPTWSLYWKGA